MLNPEEPDPAMARLVVWAAPMDAATQEKQRKALTALWWCTNGPGWVQSSGWETVPGQAGKGGGPHDQQGERATHLRGWDGVGLDPSGGVTVIDLRRNGLQGAMPPEIGDLTHLRHLYLGDNQLQGSIPASIGQLSQLCILSLRGNNLKGSIVPELGCLTALQTLSLRDNHLSGVIPPELGRLKALKHLFLNNNNLRGPIPEELSQLEELEQLFLLDNELEGEIPESFGGLKNLKQLVMSENQLTGDIVRVSGLVNLLRLELDGNNLSGDIPSELSALHNLKILYLNNNNFTGAIPSELGALSCMERLDLSKNQLSGYIPPQIGQLFRLEVLSLNDNRLIGGIPCDLGRLHHIKLLDVTGNHLSEAPPIMGGLGLRQWQISQRKAFLNSWSMVDRLTYLEEENVKLRKENVRLKKSAPNGTALPLVALPRALRVPEQLAAAASRDGPVGLIASNIEATAIGAPHNVTAAMTYTNDSLLSEGLDDVAMATGGGKKLVLGAAATAMATPGLVKVTSPEPTKARPTRSSSRDRSLRSRQVAPPLKREDEDQRLDANKVVARRALLDSAERRGSGSSSGGCSSGGGAWGRGVDVVSSSSSEGSFGGGSRRARRSATGGGRGGGADGLSPADVEGTRHHRGNAFFAGSPIAETLRGAGEGRARDGSDGGVVTATIVGGNEVVSSVRSPTSRGEKTGGPATANGENNPPGASVATEEAHNPGYGRTWASLIRLAPPSHGVETGGATNGVGASNSVSASINGGRRGTTGSGTSARSPTFKDPENAGSSSRSGSPFGQILGLFRGIASSPQLSPPSLISTEVVDVRRKGGSNNNGIINHDDESGGTKAGNAPNAEKPE